MKKLFTAIALIALSLILIFGLVQWLQSPHDTGNINAGDEGAVQSEAAWCPVVELISIPGTSESSVDDDPFNPSFNPNALLLTVTQPLQNEYDDKTLRVWTTPYPAQIRNVGGNQEDMTLDDSRQVGTDIVNNELSYVASECPNTKFLLMGFSQGAIIAGDITSEIGQNRGVIPPEKLLSSALLADSRRDHSSGVDVSTPVAAGQGIEIALKPYGLLTNRVTPGSTLRGAREGGFGVLNDETFVICGEGDTVCSIEDISIRGLKGLGEALMNNVHASYRENPDVIEGTTVPQWLQDWVRRYAG